jgi:hypothetical protein
VGVGRVACPKQLIAVELTSHAQSDANPTEKRGHSAAASGYVKRNYRRTGDVQAMKDYPQSNRSILLSSLMCTS